MGATKNCSLPLLAADAMLDVAVVSEFPTLLGGERSLLAAAAVLSATRAVQFHVVVPAGDVAAAWAEIGAFVYPWENLASAPMETRRVRVAKLLSGIHAGLVHANSLTMGRLLGPVIEQLRVPSIAHLRDIVGLSGPAIADLNRHTRLLAVSEAVRRFHIGQGIDAARIAVLYNGVDLGEFAPRPATKWLHQELGLPVDAQLVICVGQIILRKGWDCLLAAAAEVVRRSGTAHFVIVGGRHSDKAETQALAGRIEAAASGGPLAGRLHLLGVRRDVAAILPEAALVAHAARQEPLGRVLLEAAASGRAVVATDVGGTREIFPDRDAGALLVPVDRPAELADAISALLCQPELREELGMRGRRRAEACFDARLRAEELLGHYRAVAGVVG